MDFGGDRFNGITEGLMKAWGLKAQAAAKPVKQRYKYFDITLQPHKHRQDDEGQPTRKVQIAVKYQMDTKTSKDYRGKVGPKELARAARRARPDLAPILNPVLEAAE